MNNPISDTENSQNHQQTYNNQREKLQQPYNDLREILNKKRQFKQSEKPPSDPKYNFLSDPIRDGAEKSISEIVNDRKCFQKNYYVNRVCGNEKLDSGYYHTIQGRHASRGRGRGYSSNYTFQQSQPKTYVALSTSEEHKIDKSRNVQSDLKQEEKSKQKSDSQIHSLPYRQERKNIGTNKSINSLEQNLVVEGKNYRQDNQTMYDSHRKNFSRGRSFHKYSTQYNSPRQNKNLREPLNITVEFSVNSGIRKCTIGKIENGTNREAKPNVKERIEVQCEENWDENVQSTCKESAVSEEQKTDNNSRGVDQKEDSKRIKNKGKKSGRGKI